MPGSNESGRAEVFVVPDGDKGAYIISSADQKLQINQLTISAKRKFKLSPFMTVMPDLQLPLSKPVNAVVLGQTMVIISGQHGCGFRWDPVHWLVVNLEKKSTQAVTVCLSLRNFKH
jgi:hypothetical protein